MFSSIAADGLFETAARIVGECAFEPIEWEEIIVESDGLHDQFAKDLKRELQSVKDGLCRVCKESIGCFDPIF